MITFLEISQIAINTKLNKYLKYNDVYRNFGTLITLQL